MQPNHGAVAESVAEANRCSHLLPAVFAVRRGCRDRSLIDAALGALAVLSAMLEAQRLVCAEALAEVSPRPDVDLADGLRSGRRDAERAMQRLDVAQRAPQMCGALGDGRVGAAHLDELGSSLRRLDGPQQDGLLAELPALVEVAAQMTADQFGRRLRLIERHLRADDGQALFERQRRAVRLHSWVGREDGMYVWKLAVDPLTGLRLNARLNAATESMFHGGLVPPGAPQDGIERQAFLRAHALVGLLDGYAGGGRPGRPEWVVVEDRRVPAGASPVVDLGLAVELPATVLSRIRAEAVERAVTLDGPVVVGGPGRANLGRASRLASEDQRRLLRALYATCAIDGCTVPFGACVIHHVVWWRHGGRTDLDNLVPICIRHHHRLHDGGWSARLDEHRQLHIRTPSGQTMVSGPNRIEHTAQHTSDSVASVQARPPPSTPPG